MSSTMRASGQITDQPISGIGSGQPTTTIPLDETVALSDSSMTSAYNLTVDGPVNVDFGTLDGANVIFIKTIGGRVVVRLTSAAGTTQAVPVDSILFLICTSEPITAIDLERVAGQDTRVNVALGQAA